MDRFGILDWGSSSIKHNDRDVVAASLQRTTSPPSWAPHDQHVRAGVLRLSLQYMRRVVMCEYGVRLGGDILAKNDMCSTWNGRLAVEIRAFRCIVISV